MQQVSYHLVIPARLQGLLERCRLGVINSAYMYSISTLRPNSRRVPHSHVPAFTSPVTLSSISLSFSPARNISSTMLPFFPPGNTHTVQSHHFLLPKLYFCQYLCLQVRDKLLGRTVSCPNLWFHPQSFPYHDRRVWVILLHSRIGAGEK